jgi:uncharacterized protein YndB with AHSA1/START domain
MARVRGSIDIDRPIEEVFDVVADQTNEPLYNPAMTSSHRFDAGPIGARGICAAVGVGRAERSLGRWLRQTRRGRAPA